MFPFLYQNSNYTNIHGGSEISSGFDTDYKDIYKLLEFENIVNGHRVWNRKNERNYEGLKSKIEEIIALCEKEISLKNK